MFPRGWQCWAGGTQVGRLKVKGFNARKTSIRDARTCVPTSELVSWACCVCLYSTAFARAMRSRTYSLR